MAKISNAIQCLLFSGFSIFTLAGSLASENCSTGCESVLLHAPFSEKKISYSAASKEKFHSLLCTASWSNAQEALSAGIEATVPIYDLPVPFNLNWDNSKVNQWKSSNCNETEIKSDYVVALSIALHEVDPSGVPAWTQCIQTKCGRAESLVCGQQAAGEVASFKARWNQGIGEPDTSAPTVQLFQVFNATCPNPPKVGQKVHAGGSITPCTVNSADDDTIFVLQTDRGYCLESVQVDRYDRVLQGRQTLSQDMLIDSKRLLLKDNLVIYTNGYDLTIKANRIDVEGMPRILAFEASPQVAPSGRPAGKIIIDADEIRGGTLRIENFGETGTVGNVGLPGSTGPTGARGSPRDLNFAGCSSGTDGHPGGVGGVGGAGGPGGAGGRGGDVQYKIVKGLGDGLIKRLDIRTTTLDRHNQLVQCTGTCGGEGGVGGPGGAGGAGGAGGNGAGGSAVCGGTNAGPPGPPGPVGPQGSEGARGDSGKVIIEK